MSNYCMDHKRLPARVSSGSTARTLSMVLLETLEHMPPHPHLSSAYLGKRSSRLDEGWIEGGVSWVASPFPDGLAAWLGLLHTERALFPQTCHMGAIVLFLYHLFFFFFFLCPVVVRLPLLFRNNQMLIA